MQQRLQATYDDDAYPYESAGQFKSDIKLIADSLTATRANMPAVCRTPAAAAHRNFRLPPRHAGRAPGCDGASAGLGELLGEDDWLEWSAERRSERLVEAIESKESAPDRQSTVARKTLAVFQAIAFCRRKYGKEAIGPFIISMTQGADDMLSILLLANWSELHTRTFNVPLDIAPLLETVDDLQAARTSSRPAE